MGRQMGINEAGGLGNTVPANYQQTIKDDLSKRLKDPYTAHIEIGEPEKSSCDVGIYGPHWGWRVPVDVNAKNSFGGYTGVRRYWYWLNGAGFVDRISADAWVCPVAFEIQ